MSVSAAPTSTHPAFASSTSARVWTRHDSGGRCSTSSPPCAASTWRNATAGSSYTLTGKVVDGSVRTTDGGVDFRVRDREGSTSVPVSYSGAIPDPFREGREVIITVRKQGATFVGERDSLVTKCPSKFTEDATQKS